MVTGRTKGITSATFYCVRYTNSESGYSYTYTSGFYASRDAFRCPDLLGLRIPVRECQMENVYRVRVPSKFVSQDPMVLC